MDGGLLFVFPLRQHWLPSQVLNKFYIEIYNLKKIYNLRC